jgi:iron(III) transport system substrate-binding protein
MAGNSIRIDKPEWLTRNWTGKEIDLRSLRTISLAVTVATLAACGAQPTFGPTPAVTPVETASGGSITVYSGRSEQLVGPLVEQFRTATGITVNVRYADTAELAILLIEEGANSPADVFFAQDAGALGAVAQENMLAELPAGLLGAVPEAFRSPAGEWVGISGRARVIAYDSAGLGEADLPGSIDELTGEEWRGRIGWAPTNGSFQSFVTALRQLRGEDGARAWLSAMLANDPVRYEGNSPIVQAIADGEIDLGLVNHYYALRQRAEQGDEFPVGNHFLPANDPGALVNVAGAGLLATSRNESAALRFIEYLLAADAQRYFAEQTFEYPLVAGVDQPAGTPALADVGHPDIDLSDLADLEGSLALLNEVGVLP